MILGGGDGWHVGDLVRAAGSFGLAPILADYRALAAELGFSAAAADPTDFILARSMPAGSLEQVVFRMDVLHRAVARGVRVVNPPAALEACIDKYLSLARLEAAGLPVPPTIVCQSADDALAAFARLGGDVVVKPLFGSEGRGLVRLTDPEIAWRTFHALERMQFVLYVQQFLANPGWDARAFVVGDRVIAAMRRVGGDDWRTNVARGGRAEPMAPDRAFLEMAVRAARAVRAEIAGVDLMPTDMGWFVLEVNAVPGWRALRAVTGIDVAGEIVAQVVGG